MRVNLAAASRDLADETFHAEVWTNPRQPVPDKRFQFQEAVAYVVDDLDVRSPQTLIGDVLASEEEFARFEDLFQALNAMLKRIGSTGTYTQASATTEWQQVQAAARRLYEGLARSDTP
jgi:hypothetical protein